MKITSNISDLTKAHEVTLSGLMFYSTLESIRGDINLLGYVSVIGRAWEELKLNGVLCLDCRPVLYFKEHDHPLSLRDRLRLQRLFWNQGVANILVLADPTTVYIYSGLIEPQNELSDKDVDEHSLIETLKLADYVQRIRTLFHDLATGHYYEEKKPAFSPDQTVDAWLLNNLRALRNVLIDGNSGLSPSAAHAFIGRVLFLCYLLDRGIVSIGQPESGMCATALLARRLESDDSFDVRLSSLYELFSDLKTKFNGNMFDQDLENEKKLIQPVHLDKLSLFLGGHEVERGQRCFGFWPYDFKMIPVETISAVYEDFLTTEDPKNKREKGAFYTPRFLAEMVVDTAVRNNMDILGGSFLDPSCGSGIFLVILFNRLANRWIHSQTGRITYSAKAEALRNILARQIRGVDIEETACRIACFSLYLAYLDFFDPPDIQNHVKRTGQPLPKLLDYGDIPDRPPADIPVILKADFLAKETLSGESFQCIIGNPPWEGRGSKQIAQAFMSKTPELLKKDGTGCLLLPTKILHNQTADAFQAGWLKLVTLETVLQLADYRRLLFQNAIAPAFIARFKNTLPKPSQYRIEFIAPKFNRNGLRKGVVTVDPSTRTWIPLSDILAATRSKSAPVVWKRRLWGTRRDQKLLDLLQSLPLLNDHVDVFSDLRKHRKEKTKRWVSGQGIKPFKKSKTRSDRPLNELKWSLDTPIIETNPWKSDLLLMENDSIRLEERLNKKEYRSDVLYSQPPVELFHQPMVLISQGFSKIAFSDHDLLFQHSLQSIAGPEKDSALLMFLAAYLRSKLARYFLFHTSANWGSERDKVHFNELLRVPLPLPGHDCISPDSKIIVNQIVQKIIALKNQLQKTFNAMKSEAEQYSLFDKKATDTDISKKWLKERNRMVKEVQDEIEPLIYSYFGLTDQEIMLVEDTIDVFEPSSTPTTWNSFKIVTLDPIEKARIEPYKTKGLAAYADTLTRTLNQWAEAEGSPFKVHAEGGTDHQTGLAIVTVSLADSKLPFKKTDISHNLAKHLNELHQHVSAIHGNLIYHRDILLFQGEHIHIVRPNILLNWTRTAALNDAARIYGEIAQAREES